MYAKILVPIDGSETSARGLNEAIKIAKGRTVSCDWCTSSMSSFSITPTHRLSTPGI